MAVKRYNLYTVTHHESTGAEASPVTFVSQTITSAWGIPAALGITVGPGEDAFGVSGTIILHGLEDYFEGSSNHMERVEYPFTWMQNSFSGSGQGYLFWGTQVLVSQNLAATSIHNAVTKTAAGTTDTLSVSLSAAYCQGYNVLCEVRGVAFTGRGYVS